MTRTLQNVKKKALPKSPKTANEVREFFENDDLRDQYGKTIRLNADGTTNYDGQTMFFKTAFESDEFSHVIFASDDIVKSIEKSSTPENRVILTDATFKIVPRGIFTQLLIVYALVINQVSFNYKK